MRVQILRTNYPHWGKYSGINQYLKYLDQDAYQVEPYLVSDNDEDFPLKNAYARKMLRTIVQRQGMQWYKLSDLAAEVRTYRDSSREKTDLVHYLDGEHSAQYLPLLMGRFNKKRPRFLATYHQPPELLDKLIRKDIVSRLDGISVVAEEQVAYFHEFVEPEKVHLIHHGVDAGFFRPGAGAKDDNKFRCILVGHYLRDYDALKEVAKRLSRYEEIEFQVVSSQSDGLRDCRNVKLFTGISDEELLKLYQQADLMFLPLIKSTANNALLEGIACGLPIVSSLLPSVKAYLPGEEAILVENNDVDHLSEAVLYLWNNPEVRKTMGQKSRHRAEELDWRNIARQYETVYSQLFA